MGGEKDKLRLHQPPGPVLLAAALFSLLNFLFPFFLASVH